MGVSWWVKDADRPTQTAEVFIAWHLSMVAVSRKMIPV